MIKKQVLVKNLKVNYIILGRGKPFLILHGWGSKYDRWLKVGELLVKRNFRVFIPDLPGFGESQKLQYPWNLDDYVEWVWEFSRVIPDLKNKFYLLGNSFGGAVAAKFSIKYGQQIEQLFLVASSGIRKKTLRKKILAKTSKVIRLFSFSPFYNLIKRAFYKFVVGSSDYLKAEGAMKETFLKVIAEDLSEKLSFIRVPTTIIWGNKDKSTPLEQGKIINKKIENSKLIVINGGDHYLQHKTPELLTQKILAQLNSAER